jgi:hypothetical protein
LNERFIEICEAFYICEMSHSQEPQAPEKSSTRSWLKKIGIIGILFFVIKGCITTALLILAGQGLWQGCH